MKIFPAIDIMDGRCVRLQQGNFSQTSFYEPLPVDQARYYAQEGAEWIHVVDLDGARLGKGHQVKIISDIAKSTSLKVQAGGGVRSKEDIVRLLDAGVKRVIVGSVAVDSPDAVWEWFSCFGYEALALALDVSLGADNVPYVVTRGWQDKSSTSLWAIMKMYEKCGSFCVLCTDVSRDGMLVGPSLDLYRRILEDFPDVSLLASGGIADIQDITRLRDLGVAGAITGKALYEGKFSLSDAIKEAGYAR